VEEKFKTRIIEEFHVVVEFTIEKDSLGDFVKEMVDSGAGNFEINKRPKYPVGEHIAQED